MKDSVNKFNTVDPNSPKQTGASVTAPTVPTVVTTDEADETHETDDGTRQDERHAPITLHIMTGNQRTQNVTHRRMRIPNSKYQT